MIVELSLITTSLLSAGTVYISWLERHDTADRHAAAEARWDEERRRYVSALLLKGHSEPAAASVIRGPQAPPVPAAPTIFQEGI